jgi:hypothetical protein
MASDEWVRAHRELEYLRVAWHEGKRGTSPQERSDRRKHADERWTKLNQVKKKDDPD